MQRPLSEWIDLTRTASAGHPADPLLGYHFIALLYRLGAWKPGDFIVDVGSGNGNLAIPLAGERVRYLGIEPIRECVDFCQRVFAPYEHMKFLFVDLRNDAYNPAGAVRPERFRIAVEDGAADLVIFSSVFTHLERMDVCRHYLAETHRILRHGGKAWVTWFRHPPNEPNADPGRSVFPEWEIIEAIKAFTIVHAGGGLTTGFHDQWQMLLQKA